MPDRIVIGGPSNSTTRHGPQNLRGFGAERRMIYKEDRMGMRELKVEYHLTEPTKISMLERARLIRGMEELVKFCEENFPTSTAVYLDMFPRFVDRCCANPQHMTKDDLWVLDNSRREIDREIRMRVERHC